MCLTDWCTPSLSSSAASLRMPVDDSIALSAQAHPPLQQETRWLETRSHSVSVVSVEISVAASGTSAILIRGNDIAPESVLTETPPGNWLRRSTRNLRLVSRPLLPSRRSASLSCGNSGCNFMSRSPAHRSPPSAVIEPPPNSRHRAAAECDQPTCRRLAGCSTKRLSSAAHISLKVNRGPAQLRQELASRRAGFAPDYPSIPASHWQSGPV